MKGIFSFIILFNTLFSNCFSQSQIDTNWVLQGKISSNNYWSDTIFLLKIDHIDDLFNGSEALIVDTAYANQNGEFTFSKEKISKEERIYRLSFVPKGSKNGGMIMQLGKKTNYIFLILNDQLEITLNVDSRDLLNTYAIKGYLPNSHLQELVLLNAPLRKDQDQFANLIGNAQNLSTVEKDSLFALFKESQIKIHRNIQENIFNFLSSNYYHPIVYIIGAHYHSLSDFSKNLDYYTSILNRIDPKNYYYNQFKEILDNSITSNKFDIKNIIAQTSDGEIFDLEKQNARYFLIDFWASWCKPCRTENRTTLKKVYENFKEKGLQIISFSVDTSKQRWLDAIEADNIEWINISELQSPSKSSIAKMFGVQALPRTFILNKEKDVIAKDLFGVDLEEFIEQLFQNEK